MKVWDYKFRSGKTLRRAGIHLIGTIYVLNWPVTFLYRVLAYPWLPFS